MGTFYENRQKVLQWLKGQGYKIGKTKLYRDADAGLLILEPDGSVRRESVDRYIKVAGLKQPAAQTVEAAARVDQKTAEEIRQLQLRNEKLQHEVDVLHGKYIPKTDHDADLVDLAALLDALPRHVLRMNLSRYLAAINADPSRASDFLEMFEADFTTEVNSICAAGSVELVEAGHAS